MVEAEPQAETHQPKSLPIERAIGASRLLVAAIVELAIPPCEHNPLDRLAVSLGRRTASWRYATDDKQTPKQGGGL
jgi:hypothetical protein